MTRDGALTMRLLVPTPLGWKALAFLGMTALVYHAAPYNNLFFLLLTFLLVVAILVVQWTRGNMKGIAGAVADIEPAPAGSPHRARLQIHPRGKARRGIRLLVQVAGEWHPLGAVAEVHEDLEWGGELAGLPRGVHQVAMAVVESRHPFGVLRKRAPIDGPAEVVAHPRPAELPRLGSRAAVLAALTGQLVTAGADTSPAGLRPYREGEPLQRVHWKASARRQDLVLLDMDGEADQALEVVLDRRLPAGMDPTDAMQRLEDALSLATALVLEEMSAKHPFTLRSQDHGACYGPGQIPARDALAWLAGVTPLPADGPPPPMGSSMALRLPLAGTAAAPGMATPPGPDGSTGSGSPTVSRQPTGGRR